MTRWSRNLSSIASTQSTNKERKKWTVGAGKHSHITTLAPSRPITEWFEKSARQVLPLAPARSDRPSVSCRSEEHTSELQSLMRISSAVFCLKKKQQHKK